MSLPLYIHGNNKNLLTFESGDVEDIPIVNPKIVVIRCYNKSPEDMRGLYQRLEVVRQVFPFDVILIVTDRRNDKGGTTECSTVATRSAVEYPVVVLRATSPVGLPAWTTQLNGVLAFFQLLGIRIGWILNMSFDVSIEGSDDQKNCVAEAMAEEPLLPILTVRNCPEELLTTEEERRFFADPMQEYLSTIQKMREYTSGKIGFGDWVSVLPHACRNTFFLDQIPTVRSTGGYNPLCSRWKKGMEDVTRVAHLTFHNHPGFVGVMDYNDPTIRDDERSREKLAGEIEGCQLMLKYLRQLFNVTGDEDPAPKWEPDFLLTH